MSRVCKEEKKEKMKKYKVRPFGHSAFWRRVKRRSLRRNYNKVIKGGQVMWFIILLKDFYLFKIVELEIFLK